MHLEPIQQRRNEVAAYTEKLPGHERDKLLQSWEAELAKFAEALCSKDLAEWLKGREEAQILPRIERFAQNEHTEESLTHQTRDPAPSKEREKINQQLN